MEILDIYNRCKTCEFSEKKEEYFKRRANKLKYKQKPKKELKTIFKCKSTKGCIHET